MKLHTLGFAFRNFVEAFLAISSAVLGILVLIITILFSPVIDRDSLNNAIIFWTLISASIGGMLCLVFSFFLPDRTRTWTIALSVLLWIIAVSMLASPMANNLIH